jgi:hypothetical protein
MYCGRVGKCILNICFFQLWQRNATHCFILSITRQFPTNIFHIPALKLAVVKIWTEKHSITDQFVFHLLASYMLPKQSPDNHSLYKELKYKIWGSHGGEDIYVGLLGSNTVWTILRREIQTFRRNILSPSSALKLEVVCSTETLVSTYKSTRRYYPEEQHPWGTEMASLSRS